MTKTACVILAPGTEEMEFVIAADILRRAGVDVTIAGVGGSDVVTCSQRTLIKPDVSLESVADKSFDVIVLPGGRKGSEEMGKSPILKGMLKKQDSKGGYIAAICAAPTVLATNEIGYGKTLTSYISCKDKLADKFNYVYKEPVVQDGNLITSQGPGTSFLFALKITEILVGKEKAKEVSKAALISNFE